MGTAFLVDKRDSFILKLFHFVCEKRFMTSVAKGPKFRPQTTKGVEKNCVGPGKSAAELLANLSKKGRKGSELFL
jgi:anthranilate/para-aminobenzoate synthase component II